jgi:hypothetical protein
MGAMLREGNARGGKLATQLLTAYYAALSGKKCLIASPAGTVSITLVKPETKGRSAETITLDEWDCLPGSTLTSPERLGWWNIKPCKRCQKEFGNDGKPHLYERTESDAGGYYSAHVRCEQCRAVGPRRASSGAALEAWAAKGGVRPRVSR